jgi:hypothetical protein
MSYDLYFKRSQPLPILELRSFFVDRRHYEMNGDQAWYGNEDTGVYFSFEPSEPEKDAESEFQAQAAFNMNMFRPHFFALEAAPEIDAFVRHFEFEIFDPQMGGMADGIFSMEGFIRSWNNSNQFGYRAYLQQEPSPDVLHTRPTEELEAVWRWNHQKESIQSSLGEDIFVPRIMWVTVGGQLGSAVVWPDGISTLIPQVDMIIVGRDELAPRRFFRAQKDTCAITQASVDGILAPFEAGAYPLPCRVPQYASPPENVERFVRGLPADSRPLEGITADKILNQELVEAARNRGS